MADNLEQAVRDQSGLSTHEKVDSAPFCYAVSDLYCSCGNLMLSYRDWNDLTKSHVECLHARCPNKGKRFRMPMVKLPLEPQEERFAYG